MLTLLEDQLMRLLRETAGLGLVRHTSSVIAATTEVVAIGDLSAAAGVSSTHLARRFKELIGVTPKRLAHPGARCRRGIGDAVGMEYVSRVPRPPLDGLIDDLYYLAGAPPYALLTLPPAPSALLIVNLGSPFSFAPAPTSRPPSTPTGAWSPRPPVRSSSATRSRPDPSACTSSLGGWRRSCRCPRASCATGR